VHSYSRNGDQGNTPLHSPSADEHVATAAPSYSSPSASGVLLDVGYGTLKGRMMVTSSTTDQTMMGLFTFY